VCNFELKGDSGSKVRYRKRKKLSLLMSRIPVAGLRVMSILCSMRIGKSLEGFQRGEE
jgi:hypothetical protein